MSPAQIAWLVGLGLNKVLKRVHVQGAADEIVYMGTLSELEETEDAIFFHRLRYKRGSEGSDGSRWLRVGLSGLPQ